MANDRVEQNFKAVLAGIGACLSAHGFAKRGNAYRRLSSGNSAIIEVQRSQSSTSNAIRFTLNVGVICGRLLDDFQPNASKAGSMHAHLRERIGAFLPTREDKWWVIDAATNPDDLASEIGDLLDAPVQFLLDHLTDVQLISLWETGTSPGLTKVQRQRYLRELKAA